MFSVWNSNGVRLATFIVGEWAFWFVETARHGYEPETLKVFNGHIDRVQTREEYETWVASGKDE